MTPTAGPLLALETAPSADLPSGSPAAALVVAVGLLVVVGLVVTDYRRFRRYDDRTSWWRWRRWTVGRRWRRLQGYLVNRVLLSHLSLIKAVFVLGVTGVAYLVADSNAVVAAATVLYASMLFFDGLLERAALVIEDGDVFRHTIDDELDFVHVDVTVLNAGRATAEEISIKARVVDPVRDRETQWHRPQDGSDEPLESRLSREYTIFIEPTRYNTDRMAGGYSGREWVEIRVDTPYQRVSTWLYERLSDAYASEATPVEG